MNNFDSEVFMTKSKQEVYMDVHVKVNYTIPEEIAVASLNHEVVSPSVSNLGCMRTTMLS
jgi:Zn-dependent alcohol dehydrogenase